MFIIIYSTFCIDSALCQIDNNEIIPPSPTAASLGQFGDIPIGYYTGTPNISIPLYEIKSGSLTLPINLSYNATGIRVSQDASWVGLGWSLSAGGLITRTVRGNDDFRTFDGFYHKANLPEPDNYNRYDPYASTSDSTNDQYYWRSIINGSIDGDPDVFSYNFGNYSGTFIIDKLVNGSKAFCVQINNLKIEGNYYFGTSSFKITTPDGVEYSFGTREVATNSYNNVWSPDTDLSTISGVGNFGQGSSSPTTSWYLDSIVSPNGDRIDFTYTTGESLSLINQSLKKFDVVSGTVNRGPNGGDAPSQTYFCSFSRQRIFDVLLSQITFQNGKIDFITSDRDDIEQSTNTGAPKPQKLSNIKIKDSFGNFIKDIELFHTYFVSHDYANNPSTKYHGKRLKLDTVQVGSDPDNTYAFTYENPGGLPDKYSKQFDEWGFYTMPFTYSGVYSPVERSDYTGDYVKRGTLTSITYPTKGKTVFEYEPHTLYGSLRHENQTRQYRAILDYIDRGNIPDDYIEEPIETFTITSAPGGKQVTLSYISDFNDPDNKAFLRNSNGLAIQILSPGDINSPVLQEGTYTLEVRNIPIGYKGELKASYTEYVAIPDAGSSGNGIRIKNITNFDAGNSILGKKHFIYTNDGTETGSSSGWLLIEPSFEYSRDIIIDQGIHNGYYYRALYDVRSLHSFIPAGFNSPPNVVGYDSVTVQDSLDGTIGTTTYNYHNEIFDYFEDLGYEEDFPELPKRYDTRNGQLISVIQKNSQGDIVKKTLNNYELKSQTSVKGVKFYRAPFEIGETFKYEDDLIRYYDNISEWWVTSSVIETIYDKNGNSPITTTTYYDYENPDHKNLTKTTTTNSKGETIMATNKYPQDLPSGIDQTTSSIIAGMVTDHIIAPVLKSETTVNGNLVQGTINNYKTQNGLYLPLNIKKLKRGSTIDYDKNIEFVSYDNNGHIQEIKKPDGTPVSYVWGYNKEFPIAKIENATYSQVLNQVANLQDLSNLDDDHCLDTETCDEKNLRTALTALRTSLSGAMVSTYTYDPLIGVTSMTDPKGYTVYYVYDVYNRLEYVKDASGKILSRNEYRYKTQP